MLQVYNTSKILCRTCVTQKHKIMVSNPLNSIHEKNNYLKKQNFYCEFVGIFWFFINCYCMQVFSVQLSR